MATMSLSLLRDLFYARYTVTICFAKMCVCWDPGVSALQWTDRHHSDHEMTIPGSLSLPHLQDPKTLSIQLYLDLGGTNFVSMLAIGTIFIYFFGFTSHVLPKTWADCAFNTGSQGS